MPRVRAPWAATSQTHRRCGSAARSLSFRCYAPPAGRCPLGSRQRRQWWPVPSPGTDTDPSRRV
jgi:hypothetical protein